MMVSPGPWASSKGSTTTESESRTNRNQSRVLGAIGTHHQRIHLMVSESIRVHSGGMIRTMAFCNTDGGVNAWAHQLGLGRPGQPDEVELKGAWGPWAPTHVPCPFFLGFSS